MGVGSLLKRRWVRWVLAVVVAVLAVYAFTAASVAFYRGPELPARADAAVVLGNAVRNYEPSPVFKARIDHGIDLYRAGRVRKLCFTGGTPPGDDMAEAVAARRYAVRHGVPESDIVMETESHTTYQNLYHARPVLERHGLRSLVLVTDLLHMKRAMRQARDLRLRAWPSATPYTQVREPREKVRWVRRETRLYLGYLASRRFLPPDRL